MNLQRKQKTLFDVVDLDPYGSAVPFLESALNSLADGGLLAVTFTDMAVLCARTPHVCFYKYGASPLSKRYCHEVIFFIHVPRWLWESYCTWSVQWQTDSRNRLSPCYQSLLTSTLGFSSESMKGLKNATTLSRSTAWSTNAWTVNPDGFSLSALIRKYP